MKKKSILLIDDEETILASLGHVLRNNGYEVFTSANGKDGLDILNKNRPALIITDLMLDGMSGIDVLKEAKKIQPDIMVMIITGFGELNSAIEALQLGALDYLLKPVRNKELVLRIDKCFERWEMQLKIKVFENIVPICSTCRSIRDDTNSEHGEGDWMSIEEYLSKNSDMQCSHGICPNCYEKSMEELNDLT